MKKIGLVTFHESDNYGTCLQACALQSYIENLGYSVEIINYQRKSIPKKPTFIERVKYIFSAYKLSNLWYRERIRVYFAQKKELFSEFRKEEFRYGSEKFECYEELTRIADKYDAVVCGSDMIWASERSSCLDIYFLAFASEEKRISYSPSFGKAAIPEELREYYKERLTQMGYLSCREESGQKLIQKMTGRDTTLTLDPTLLIDSNQWSKYARTVHPPERYILVYLFEGMPNWLKNYVRFIADHYSAQIVEIPMMPNQVCKAINRGESAVGPHEFLYLIQNAQFVFTNSYHGLMFSLIYEKPFYTVQRNMDGDWAKFEDRLLGVLKVLNCEDRMLKPGSKIGQIDLSYNEIQKHLDHMKSISTDYLKKALSTATRGK